MESGLRQGSCAALALSLAFAAGSALCVAQKGVRGVTDTTDPVSPSTNSGKYYALVVGISGYTVLPKLATPTNDAREVAAVLSGQYGFTTQLLIDPSRDRIFEALAHYEHSLASADNLLIYFAGHGNYQKAGDLAYWAPVDANNQDYARWIDAAEITATARANPARHVLVISDSCFSGMLSNDIPPGAISTAASSNLDNGASYMDKLAQRRSRTLLSSGDNEPVADDDATDEHFRGHSIFANALLDDLYRLPEDEFTGEQLSLKLQEQVWGRAQQRPVYRPIEITHNDGDFVFIRTGKRTLTTGSDATADTHSWKDNTHPAPNPEKQAVATALDNYEQAYSSMDLHEVKRVWPSLSKSQEKEIKGGFDAPDLKAVHVELRNRSTSIAGDTAVADCDQWMTYTFAGRRQPPQTNSVEISLAKNSHGDWAINGVRAR